MSKSALPPSALPCVRCLPELWPLARYTIDENPDLSLRHERWHSLDRVLGDSRADGWRRWQLRPIFRRGVSSAGMEHTLILLDLQCCICCAFACCCGQGRLGRFGCHGSLHILELLRCSWHWKLAQLAPLIDLRKGLPLGGWLLLQRLLRDSTGLLALAVLLLLRCHSSRWVGRHLGCTVILQTMRQPSHGGSFSACSASWGLTCRRRRWRGSSTGAADTARSHERQGRGGSADL